MRRKHRIVEDKRDFREGLQFCGRWYTPEELHAICEARMQAFDKLPKKKRDSVNERGA